MREESSFVIIKKMRRVSTFFKIKKILVISILLALLLGAGLFSSQFDAETTADDFRNIATATSYICNIDTFEDIVASDESENKSAYLTSNSGNSHRIVRIRPSEQTVAIFSLSVSIAIMTFAALFAVTGSSQCCLNIISTIHKKDGKK